MPVQDSTKLSAKDREFFSDQLVIWERASARNFSWRGTRNPYQVLIAELLLRRTNAKSAEAVFNEFIRKYPTLDEFKYAKERTISEILYPLGLKWRAKNVFALAQLVKARNLKAIPLEIQQLKSLPGVGDYVSRAVLINCADHRIVAVDNNVVRVVCRYFGIVESDSLRRQREFQSFVDSLIGRNDARLLNYALLDLASGVCVSTAPKCPECPLQSRCKFAIASSKLSTRRTSKKKV